jgi:hypothetical protein
MLPKTMSAYFLMQRQFESTDGDLVCMKTHEEALCGRFRVGKAQLGRGILSKNGAFVSKNKFGA